MRLKPRERLGRLVRPVEARRICWKRHRWLGVFVGVRVLEFLMLYLLLETTGFFRKISLVLGEKLTGYGGCLRLILAGLDSKQLPSSFG